MKTVAYAGVSALLISTLAGPQAFAGGFALHERSAAAQGASFAGADSGGDDITFAGFNPAALGNVERFEFGGNASLIMPDVDGKTTTGFGTARIDPSDLAFVPATAVGARLTDSIVVGLTVYSPFGLTTEYPSNALEWPAGGAGLESELINITATPLVAWNVTPELTIAAGPQIHYAKSTLSRALPTPPELLPELLVGKLTGDTFAFGWQMGVLFKPRPGTTLGFSYTSGYTVDIDGKFRSPLGTVDATAEVNLPAVFGFGIRQNITEDVRLLADLRYFDWSAFDKITIGLPEGFFDATEITDYNDAFFIAVGLEADVSDSLTLRAGVAYDDTPTTNALRSPRIPDADRIWGSVGASYQFSDSMKLDFAYSLLMPEDSTVKENGMTIPADIEYSGLIHIVSLGVSMKF